eukprot:11743198-Alexandrium_andersonii.AAC.1
MPGSSLQQRGHLAAARATAAATMTLAAQWPWRREGGRPPALASTTAATATARAGRAGWQ